MTQRSPVRSAAQQVAFYVYENVAEHAPVREALATCKAQKRDVSALARKGLVIALAIETRDFETLARMLPADIARSLLPEPAPVIVEIKMPQWATGVQMPLPFTNTPSPRQEVIAEFETEASDSSKEFDNNLALFDTMFD